MFQVATRTTAWIGLLVVSLFGPAQTFDWPLGWSLLGIYSAIVLFALLTVDRELLQERASPSPGYQRSDALIAGAGALLLYPLTLLVAGLDFAGGWGARIPLAASLVAQAVFTAGYLLAIWALRTNNFFTTFVRIQRDRGHHLVDQGPYAWVRHPGYSGVIVAHMAIPVALGTPWALVPALLGCLLFLVRTAHEDRTLTAKLEGYTDYRRRVRWRLAPGVW